MLLMVYTFHNLLGLLEFAIMLRTSRVCNYVTDTEAPCLDLHLSIANGFVSSKIYDKRDDTLIWYSKLSVFGW